MSNENRVPYDTDIYVVVFTLNQSSAIRYRYVDRKNVAIIDDTDMVVNTYDFDS